VRANQPELCPQLPDIDGVPRDQVIHTFRVGTTYCVETLQWACGSPIGWGTCYKSESSPQVLAILDHIWEDHLHSQPAFISYDDACDLLCHIVMENPNSLWLLTTRFIVDAWHYIGHHTTDILCRTWCNPTPANGSNLI
jgi:hypothetical protein